MKAINIILTASLLAVAATACVQNDNYTPAVASESLNNNNVEKEALTIVAGFNATKSASVIKTNWNTSESIAVVSEYEEARFLSITSGNMVEFAACSSIFDANNVAAVYPYIKNVANGADFSFNGQNGTLENINNFNLMIANGSVRNGKANLNFNNKIAVIRFSNVTLDGCLAENLTDLQINGVAETVNVKAVNGKMNITPCEKNVITVERPALLTSDVYVAFFADNTTSTITIDVHDGMGGKWSLNLNNGTPFQAGQVYNVENVTLKGGYPITFTPSVEDWNE